MPPVFAGDPAPQQLTAPCRKYSGRLHPGIEQVVCPIVSRLFSTVFRPLFAASHILALDSVTRITKLKVAVSSQLSAVASNKLLAVSSQPVGRSRGCASRA